MPKEPIEFRVIFKIEAQRWRKVGSFILVHFSHRNNFHSPSFHKQDAWPIIRSDVIIALSFIHMNRKIHRQNRKKGEEMGASFLL